MNVLIAEDDAVSRRLLRSLLERWEHHVIEAEDGAAAWELFRQNPTQFVIADWMMPNMDGVELIRRVRALRQQQYTYTMLVTAKTQKSDLVAGMEAGADDFISKPFDRDELRVRLQAGRRILSLHSQLTAAEKNATVGRVALGLAAEVRAPLADAMTQLNELRTQSLTLSYALQLYREAHPQLTGDGDVGAGKIISTESEQLGLSDSASGLARRFTETLENLQRINGVVRSLREFASLDRYPSKPLAVRPLLIDALRMCSSLATDAAVHIRLEGPEDLGTVMGNAGKLKRLVVNLVTRAIGVSPAGATVRVLSTPEQGMVRIEVHDGGPIPAPSALKVMFDPFQIDLAATADDTRPASTPGLALSVCQSIARDHGGTAEANAGPGGTIITVTLPLVA